MSTKKLEKLRIVVNQELDGAEDAEKSTDIIKKNHALLSAVKRILKEVEVKFSTELFDAYKKEPDDLYEVLNDFCETAVIVHDFCENAKPHIDSESWIKETLEKMEAATKRIKDETAAMEKCIESNKILLARENTLMEISREHQKKKEKIDELKLIDTVKITELKVFESEINSYEDKLADLTKKIESSQGRKVALEGELKEREGVLAGLQNEISRSEEQIKTLTEEITAVQSNANGQSNKLTQLVAEKDEKEKEIAKMEKEIEEFENQLKEIDETWRKIKISHDICNEHFEKNKEIFQKVKETLSLPSGSIKTDMDNIEKLSEDINEQLKYFDNDLMSLIKRMKAEVK